MAAARDFCVVEASSEKRCPAIDILPRSMAVPDYSVGFTCAEVEEILGIHKAELKKTLVQWGDGGTSVVKRRLDEIHTVIAACQDALRKLAPEVYGRTRRAAQSKVERIIP